jgi:hypothetical protein
MFETIEFKVIGELRDDPGHLLLLDRDGQCYDYDLSRDEIVPVDPGGMWSVDVIENTGLVVEALVENVAS